MHWWLIDPSGLLHRVIPLVRSLDEAASFVRYFAERGLLLTDGTTALSLLGTTDLAAIFSFAFEERAGVDLRERYRWYGATPGEHGRAIQEAAMVAPVDLGWTERLAAVGLTVVNRRDAGHYTKSTWSVSISDNEDI